MRTGVAHSLGFGPKKRVGHGGVDGPTVGERAVEVVREGDRRRVGDRELHRDDGGEAARDQRCADACQRVLRRAARSLARVQDRSTQCGVRCEERAGCVYSVGFMLPLVRLKEHRAMLPDPGKAGTHARSESWHPSRSAE
jgi:hypothetical protein